MQNPSNLPSRIPRIYAFKDSDLQLRMAFPVGYDLSNIDCKLYYGNKFHKGLASIAISGQLVTITLSKEDFLSINLPVFDLFVYNSLGVSIIGATVEVSPKPGSPVLETFEISLSDSTNIVVEVVDSQISTEAATRAEQAALEATQANEEAQAIVPTLQTDISSRVPKATTINGKALTSNISLNKTDIGLNLVDNTPDNSKPISSLQQAALDIKVPQTLTINGKALTTNITLAKTDIGLANVDNTSDISKPISTLQQAGLDLRIPLSQKGVANGVATYEQYLSSVTYNNTTEF